METRITLLILLPAIAGLLMLAATGRGNMIKANIIIGGIPVCRLDRHRSLSCRCCNTGIVFRIFNGSRNRNTFGGIDYSGLFRIDALSQLIVLLISLFGVLISVYTLKGNGQGIFTAGSLLPWECLLVRHWQIT
jgi:NADH:ubiquinone oxidoreductase subunit 5 (subunit L)/multisubunit Na+/H+ antiporter MnhA subunit